MSAKFNGPNWAHESAQTKFDNIDRKTCCQSYQPSLPNRFDSLKVIFLFLARKQSLKRIYKSNKIDSWSVLALFLQQNFQILNNLRHSLKVEKSYKNNTWHSQCNILYSYEYLFYAFWCWDYETSRVQWKNKTEFQI